MDPIAAMMGLGLEDEEKAQLMADQLRGRKRAADFFGMTTVPTIAAGAQTEGKDVMDSAQRAGTSINARKVREQTEQLQKDRFAETERVRALQRTLKVQDDARAREELLSDNLKAEALIRAKEKRAQGRKGSEAYWTPDGIVRGRTVGGQTVKEGTDEVLAENAIPLSEYNAMLKNRTLAKGTDAAEYGDPDFEYTKAATEAERTFEERTLPESIMAGITAEASYDPAFAPVIPGTAGVENFIGNTAGIPATDLLKRQGEFWRDWKRFNELEQRHELFGSALTESEQREWRASTIGPNTRPEQIQAFLKRKGEMARKMAEYQVAQLALEGRPRHKLMAYGTAVDVDDIISRALDGSFMNELAERNRLDREATGRFAPGEGDVPGMSDAPNTAALETMSTAELEATLARLNGNE